MRLFLCVLTIGAPHNEPLNEDSWGFLVDLEQPFVEPSSESFRKPHLSITVSEPGVGGGIRRSTPIEAVERRDCLMQLLNSPNVLTVLLCTICYFVFWVLLSLLMSELVSMRLTLTVMSLSALFYGLFCLLPEKPIEDSFYD